MSGNLYEFYMPFGMREIRTAFLLEQDRETEKFYWGNAVLLDKKTGEPMEKFGRFRVEKEQVGCAQIHRDTQLVVRVFGSDFFEAKDHAVIAFSQWGKRWANDLENTLEYGSSLNERLAAAKDRSREAVSLGAGEVDRDGHLLE